MLQVLVRSEDEFVHLGEAGDDLGVGGIADLERIDGPVLFAGDLLLEERAQDDAGGARVLQPADVVEIVGER